jgi:hypothetical protein
VSGSIIERARREVALLLVSYINTNTEFDLANFYLSHPGGILRTANLGLATITVDGAETVRFGSGSRRSVFDSIRTPNWAPFFGKEKLV